MKSRTQRSLAVPFIFSKIFATQNIVQCCTILSVLVASANAQPRRVIPEPYHDSATIANIRRTGLSEFHQLVINDTNTPPDSTQSVIYYFLQKNNSIEKIDSDGNGTITTTLYDSLNRKVYQSSFYPGSLRVIRFMPDTSLYSFRKLDTLYTREQKKNVDTEITITQLQFNLRGNLVSSYPIFIKNNFLSSDDVNAEFNFYDDSGKLIRSVTGRRGHKKNKVYKYNSNGRLLSIDDSVNGKPTAYWYFHYDSLGGEQSDIQNAILSSHPMDPVLNCDSFLPDGTIQTNTFRIREQTPDTLLVSHSIWNKVAHTRFNEYFGYGGSTRREVIGSDGDDLVDYFIRKGNVQLHVRYFKENKSFELYYLNGVLNQETVCSWYYELYH